MRNLTTRYLFRLYLVVLFLKHLPIAGLQEIFLVRILQVIGLHLFVMVICSANFQNGVPSTLKKTIRNLLIISVVGSLLAGIHQSRLENVLVVINVLGFISFALYVVYWKSSRELTWFLFVLCIYTMIEMFYGVHIKSWFRGSYNHVSIIFLFGVIGYYAEYLKNKNKRMSYIPAIVVVYVAFISTGRSAILSSLWLMVIVFGFNLFRDIKGFISSLLGAIIVGIMSHDLLDYTSGYLEKFKVQGFTEAGRELVFNFARSKMSFMNALMGIDYEYLFKQYDLSIHNSFLSIHSRFGLLGLVGFVFLPFGMYLRGKRMSPIWLLLISVLYMRSFTDSILISDGFLFGPLFFVLVFSSLNSKYSKNEKGSYSYTN